MGVGVGWGGECLIILSSGLWMVLESGRPVFQSGSLGVVLSFHSLCPVTWYVSCHLSDSQAPLKGYVDLCFTDVL